MKYTVSMAINGRIDVEVEAENFEEAKEKANQKVCEADSGTLEWIDWHAVNAEADSGEFQDY